MQPLGTKLQYIKYYYDILLIKLMHRFLLLLTIVYIHTIIIHILCVIVL